MKNLQIKTLVMVTALALGACAIYIDREREAVLIEGVDVDQSLDVAEKELEKGTVLGLWALRDQVITPDQASRISSMYFAHIDEIDGGKDRLRSFNIWHLTWAISNFYRHGDDAVKAQLADAYDDAARRVQDLSRPVAAEHFEGERIYVGDFHGFAHNYKVKHLVVPGNQDYLQCYEEYLHPWKWCEGE